MQYTESGKEEEIDRLRSMAYDIISNYNIILCNWVRNKKSSSHDDRVSLMKTQISKHYKIQFGHEMYNRYIKRASFLPTHDYAGNLVNVKAVVYGTRYQKVESLEAALEVGISKVSNDSDIWFNNNKIKEIKNIPKDDSSILAMKTLGIKPVNRDWNSVGSIVRERPRILENMENLPSFKFEGLSDEEVISLTSVLESKDTIEKSPMEALLSSDKKLKTEVGSVINWSKLNAIK